MPLNSPLVKNLETRDDGLITIELEPVTDLEPLVDMMLEFHETYPESIVRLWDLSAGFNLSTEELKRVAARGADVWKGPARVAYVAPDSLGFGLLRMLEQYRNEDKYHTMVFRDRDKAMAWLEQSAELG